jgi:lipoprotein-anchoring transpeptidase ErfK/SrfK
MNTGQTEVGHSPSLRRRTWPVVALLFAVATFAGLSSVRAADPPAVSAPPSTVLVGEGRSTTSTTAPPPPPQEASRLQTALHQNMRMAGTALVDVTVFDSPRETPDGTQRTIPREDPFGTPNAFLVHAEAADEEGRTWWEVSLPEKPNQSRGWVPSEQLEVFTVDHSIVVDVSDRMLRLYRRGRLVESFSVAVGKEATPTPRGFYFVTVQLATPNPAGAYGPLALGLSAYSEVLTWWAGGGQVAIHGTNEPGSIGKPRSNGCVRMKNDDVLRLGPLAGVGTPVLIVD